MDFNDILTLLNDTTKTKYQLAADLHALMQKATAPSALNITPMKPRAKRGPNKAKTLQQRINDMDTPLINGSADDHGEAH